MFFGLILMIGSLFGCSDEKNNNQKELVSVVFNASGNVSKYKTTGFSIPEQFATWTDSETASIEIPLPDVPEDTFLRVSFDACPFLAKNIKKRTAKVFVNDEFVKDFIMTDCSDKYAFDLPHDLQKLGKVANIKFRFSGLKSPKELRLSDDPRKLGISIKKLVLFTGDKNNPEGFSGYKPGRKIDFSSKGNSSLYTKSGWSVSEPTHTWTDGQDAYMDLFVKKAKDKALRLEVLGSAILDPVDKKQNVTVYVNDVKLDSWDTSSGLATYTTVIPADVVGTGAVRIRFHIAKPVSLRTDSRKLGFAVKSIELSSRFGAKTKTKVASWVKNNVLTDSEEATKNAK